MKWSKEDLQFLEKNYPEKDRKEIEKRLKRNWGAIARKAQYLNIERKHHEWTKEEFEILKKTYPTESRKDILEKLTHRSWKSITNKAHIHGIKREQETINNNFISLENIKEHKF